MSESVVLNVSGMKCGGCESSVTNSLKAIDGILSVTASSKDKQVKVEFDAEKTGLQAIKTAIAGAGFTVENDS